MATSGSRDVTFRYKGESVEAVKATEEVKQSFTELGAQAAEALGKINDAGGTAGDGVRLVADGARQAVAPMTELDAAAKRAEESLKKLNDPETSPRRLNTELVKAATAIDQMKAEIEATKATGGVVSVEMLNRLQQYEAALANGVKRVGEMRDRMGDLRTQGALSAQSMETLAGRVGSFQGALGLAADSQSQFLQMMAKAGLAAIAFREALSLAKTGADSVRDASKSLGDQYVRLAEQSATLTQKENERVSLLHALERGYIDTKTSTDRAGEAAEQYGTKLAMQAIAARAVVFLLKGDIPAALKAAKDAMDLNEQAADKAAQQVGALEQKWKSYLAEQNHGKQVMDDFAQSIGAKIPESFERAQAAGANWNRAIRDAFEQSYSYAVEFVRANKAEIEKLIQAYRDYGQEVPEYLKKAIDVLKDDITALDEHTKASNENEKAVLARAHAYAKANEAALKLAEAVKRAIEASAQEVASAQKSADAARLSAELKIKALNQEKLSQEEYTKRKKAILEEQSSAVDAATEKENAARRKAEDSLNDVARDYGVNAEQVKKALEVQRTYNEVLDNATKAQGSMKKVSGQLVDALARQKDGVGEMTPAFDAWNKAIDSVTKNQETTVIPAVDKTATKTKELGTAMDEAAKFSGELGVSFDKLPGKMDAVTESANRATEAMRRLAEAQRGAS